MLLPGGHEGVGKGETEKKTLLFVTTKQKHIKIIMPLDCSISSRAPEDITNARYNNSSNQVTVYNSSNQVTV